MNIIEKYVKANKIQSMGLDNSHKTLLYEMCNNIIDNNNPKCSIAIDGDKVNIPVQNSDKREYIHVHWFELCTTHLCFHICGNPLKFLQKTIDYAMLVDKKEGEHPVDMLYEEYSLIRELFKDAFNTRFSKKEKNEKDYFLEKV